jgi:hypothetical protein
VFKNTADGKGKQPADCPSATVRNRRTRTVALHRQRECTPKMERCGKKLAKVVIMSSIFDNFADNNYLLPQTKPRES